MLCAALKIVQKNIKVITQIAGRQHLKIRRKAALALNKFKYRKTSNNVHPLIMSAPLIFGKKKLNTSNNVRPLIMSAPKTS